jgi:hypothetical protein
MTTTYPGASTTTGIRNVTEPSPPSAFAVPQSGWSFEQLLIEHTSWARLPIRPEFAKLIAQLRDLTGWSFRDLADILGTSHTTVGKLVNQGLVSARSQAAADKIEPLLDVLTRLARLVPSGGTLIKILNTPSPDGKPAIGLLSAGDWAGAFLAGLDVIQGPRPKRPQLRGDTPRLAATWELS